MSLVCLRSLCFHSVRCFLSAFVLVALCSSQLWAQQAANSRPAVAGVKFGKANITFFDATVKESKSSDGHTPYSFDVIYKGKKVLSVQENMESIEGAEVVENFPQIGMTTLRIFHYSGGAHCCFTEYFLTKAGDKLLITELSLPQAGEFLQLGKSARSPITVSDTEMSYYQAKSGKNSLSLSFVASPRFVRVLVFEQDRWRADKPGEFPDEYKKRIADLKKSGQKLKDMEARTANSMEIAYHGLMSGEPEAQVFESLKKSLPKDAAPLAQVIFADIKKQTQKFNPVKTTAY